MSNENRRKPADCGVTGGSHARPNIQDLSNSELLNEVSELVEGQSAEDMDVDAIMERLALLQERAPVPMDHAPGDILADLEKQHPLIFEELDAMGTPDSAAPAEECAQKSSKPRRKRRGRLLYYVTGVFAACFCLVVTANAFGFNPVQMLLEWAEGIVQIYNDPSGIMELPEDDPSEYHSLKEALDAYDMGPDQIPNWIPGDYQLLSIDISDMGSLTQCSASYTSSRGELLIRATRFPDEDWSGRTERNNDGEKYEANGLVYYLVSNQGLSKAGWEYDDVSYVISGQITEQELKNMIDSIAEGAA